MNLTGRDLMDALLVMLIAVLLYAATMLPDVGWGAEAAWQHDSVVFFQNKVPYDGPTPRLLVAAGAVWDELLPFGSPAWRLTLFSLAAAVLTLAVFLLSLRQVLAHPPAALLATAALGLAPAFYLNAVRPNPAIFATGLVALQLALMSRWILLRTRAALLSGWLLVPVGYLIFPASVPPLLAAAFFASFHRLLLPEWRAAVVACLVIIAGSAGSQFGWSAAPLLVACLALEFPVIGWLLAVWGLVLLRRRCRPVAWLLVTALAAALPLRRNLPLTDFLGMLLPALPAAAWFVAAGIEYLEERLAQAVRTPVFVMPLLAASLAALPLVAAALSLHACQNRGWCDRLVEERVFTLPVNAWRQELIYALWPPKNRGGAEAMIAEAERFIAPPAVLLLDPLTEPVIRYAQDVEGRLRGMAILSVPPEEQLPAVLVSADLMGRRIFLAGHEARFYDMEGFGKMGELKAMGGWYEWRSASPGLQP